jgi:hypothetical protein
MRVGSPQNQSLSQGRRIRRTPSAPCSRGHANSVTSLSTGAPAAEVKGSYALLSNYRHLQWLPESPVFDKARAGGLYLRDWQDVICVNMLGRRFYDETGGQCIANNCNSIEHYIKGDWRNVQRSNTRRTTG